MNAIQCIKKHGITPSTLTYKMINDWSMNGCRECLDQYYLLSWAPEHFFAQMKDGTIARDNTTYLIVYHDCTPTELRKHEQIWISFRKAKEELHIPSYAVISLKGVGAKQ